MMHRNEFLLAYRTELETAVLSYPDEYSWPLSELDAVFERMVAAFDRGSYNKDGRAFKATCNVLNIRHTYRAIDAYVDRCKHCGHPNASLHGLQSAGATNRHCQLCTVCKP